VLQGAAEIAMPTFVSTLTNCIVFVSVVFLTGPAKYLFTPMALAVVFSMLASYVLSRTLVKYLLAGEVHAEESAPDHIRESGEPSWFARFNDGFNATYLRVQSTYTGLLYKFIEHRRIALIACASVMATTFVLLPFIGRDFFPQVDTGQLRLHVRLMPGTRIEKSAVQFSQVEEAIRKVIPADQLDLLFDDIFGAIMSIGVATANSILLVPFAKEERTRSFGLRGGSLRGLDATAADHHDGLRDDRRHAADGARHGRRWRAERSARTRRHRRSFDGHLCNPILCTSDV
jgi:multidrug efflux pump subunit AcrB